MTCLQTTFGVQLLADNEKELAALREVERLFAQAAPAAKSNAPKKGDKPKKEVVQILQGARSQNVEITLSRFGLKPPELKDRLMRCDISGMEESKGKHGLGVAVLARLPDRFEQLRKFEWLFRSGASASAHA